MKNIHILPTPNPSRLFKANDELKLTRKFDFYNGAIYQNICITSNEEIKDGDWSTDGHFVVLKTKTNSHLFEGHSPKKIILTTDTQLIKDGVQAIDDEFLEWFVKNPSCEEVEVTYHRKGVEGVFKNVKSIRYYGLIIPKEEPKQEYGKQIIESVSIGEETIDIITYEPLYEEPNHETLEEVAIDYCDRFFGKDRTAPQWNNGYTAFINGAKYKQEKDRWKTVYQETPPIHVELLVQSPEGIIHLASWRESYNIFTCQHKSESSYDWKWKTI